MAGILRKPAGIDKPPIVVMAVGLDSTKEETDAYGRFDLLLTAVLDQGYQRGDQRYRNSAKLLAVPVAVCLALLGAWAISTQSLSSLDAWRAVFGGLLATPLAPVAKAAELPAGFLDRLGELALEFGGHAPHAPDRLADRAQDARQVLRPDDDQRDHANDEYLACVKIEHGLRPAKRQGRTALPRVPAALALGSLRCVS